MITKKKIKTQFDVTKIMTKSFDKWWIENNYNGSSFHLAYCQGFLVGFVVGKKFKELQKKQLSKKSSLRKKGNPA